MNKKILIASIAAIIILAFAGLYFGRMLKINNSGTNEAAISATPGPIELETWEDQSEFDFQYPKNLKLNPHPEDRENYAHIELTNNAFPGSIILWTKDTKYVLIDDFIKGEKIKNQIGSTLGELPAIKILDPEDPNKFSIITIRNGYLYQIDVDTKGEKTWNDIFSTVANSYEFREPEEENVPATNNVAPPVSSDDVYIEEEVIE